MTEQIRNKYKNKDYSMVALSNPLPFKPQRYGITPNCCTRSCYDGYWCEYEISDERITLESFCVNSKEDFYPEINGIVPLYEEKPKMFSELFKYLGHHYYKGVITLKWFTLGVWWLEVIFYWSIEFLIPARGHGNIRN